MFSIKQNSLKLLLLSTTTTSFLYGNITGVVYKDFNMNGIQDGNDAPVIGVSVNATCENGQTYHATTNTLGAYTLSGFPAGNKCRVEANTASAGVSSGTNFKGSAPLVDVVKDGATHNISAGSPATYCQENPDVIMAALPGYHSSGADRCAPNSLGNGNCRTIDFGTIFKVATPSVGSFNTNGTIPTERTTLTTFTQTGAIWGAAWKKGTKDLFVASNLKRYVPLANNAGTIYKVDMSSGGNTLSTFVTVPNITDSMTDSILDSRTYGKNEDKSIRTLVGKQGLGDLDINENETTLYTINMNTKELVAIDITSKAMNNIALPNPYGAECPDEDVRPWAIKTRGADVFIGSVCSSGIENGVGAVIQKYNGAIVSTVAKTNSLRYIKPVVALPDRNEAEDTMKYKNWGNGTVDAPILTDIEFTNSGDLVLGYTNLAAYNQSTTLNGDIRKMCLNADGTYTDESSDVATTTCTSHEVNYGLPESYYEFYTGDYFGADFGGKGHPETASGSLAVAPGTPNIIVGMIDGTEFNQPGAIGLYDNVSGDKIGAQAVINNERVVHSGEREAYGVKSGGMGDVELLCDPAPIEIGNLVWLDTNVDGIQDPNEPGIEGVTVTLSCDGTDIGSVDTDNNGHYYFGGFTNANLTGTNIITTDTSCQLHITQASVNNKPPTVANPNGNSEDQHDNDAVASGANNVINFTTTVSNNHSLDFGITPTLGCATGILFEDLNNNGTVDGSDTRAGAGISLQITDLYGNKYNTITDASGSFLVENIAAGNTTIEIDTTDTDIADGAIWSSSKIALILDEGTDAGMSCSTINFGYTLPAPNDQDPKDVATCVNPTSITWNGATVSSQTAWSTPAVNSVKTITTVGGNTIDVSMQIINDNDGEYNQVSTGTNAAFGEPYLTLYLGDQDSAGDGNWNNSDDAGCAAHGYDLEAGESYQLEVVFSEAVILDNWRIRDVDSGDLREGVANWNWQDGIKAEAFDVNGNVIAIEAKTGSSGAGLITDNQNIVHTDPATYNGGNVAVGNGSTPNATNGHIVLTSNFVPIKKLVITHMAGPDVPCQTRSALAMSGLAVCKPLYISGKVFDDKDGGNSFGSCSTSDDLINGTPINSIEGEALHVCLLDASNKVLDSQDVNASGEYIFNKYLEAYEEYRILLTTETCTVGTTAPAAKLPNGWVNEGEEFISSPDMEKDGIVEIPALYNSTEDMNFGINKIPEARDYNRPAELNPNTVVVFDIDNAADISDVVIDTNENDLGRIKIVRLPSDSNITYNGSELTVDEVIDNAIVTDFMVEPLSGGDLTTSFAYVAIDSACQESNEAIFKAEFTTLQISGKLFLDTVRDNKVNGTGTANSCDGTTPLFINLVDSDGLVSSSKAFEADGTYTFYYDDGVTKNTNYTLALSSTIGTVGSAVPALTLASTCVTLDGENIETQNPYSTDGTPDGKISVEVGVENIETINLSIGLKSIMIPPRFTLGDKVWIDANRDGIQDANESGVANVTVNLYANADCTGTEINSTTTNTSGIYGFTNLLENTYCVEFKDIPAGYEISPSTGLDDTNNSDANEDAKIKNIHLTANDPDEDMGIHLPLPAPAPRFILGDKVWIDANRDGIQDTVENGQSNVTVKLYDNAACSGEEMNTTTTDTNGKYLFTNLLAGNYCVAFSNIPAGYELSPATGIDDTTNSDINADAKILNINLVADDLDEDMGIYLPVQVVPVPPMPDPEPEEGCFGNKVWKDVNRDGIQDSSEVGVADVKVTLYTANCTTELATTKTDKDGLYLFSHLEPAEYCVEFSNLPKDYVVTTANQGSDDNKDSDVNVDTNNTGKFTVIAGENCNGSIDMGIYENKIIVITDDEVIANTKGPKTTISVLDNDGVAQCSTVKLIDANGNEVDELVVPNEGVWRVEGCKVTFTAQDGFEDIPTPAKYIVYNKSGSVSNIAEIKIITPCTCDTYKESSAPALNAWSMLLLLLASSMFGLFFMREELQTK